MGECHGAPDGIDPSGGPAFPVVHDVQPESGFKRGISVDRGMTLRDYFAAKALQGFIASGDMNMDIASLSYRYADAMLKARDA